MAFYDRAISARPWTAEKGITALANYFPFDPRSPLGAKSVCGPRVGSRDRRKLFHRLRCVIGGYSAPCARVTRSVLKLPRSGNVSASTSTTTGMSKIELRGVGFLPLHHYAPSQSVISASFRYPLERIPDTPGRPRKLKLST